METADLLRGLDRLKSIMISVATGGPKIGEVEHEFLSLYDEVAQALAERRIDNPLPYRDLWEWYGRWSSGDMPKWAQRRTFVNQLFADVTKTVQQERYRTASTRSNASAPSPAAAPDGQYDVFISHAFEDKADFVEPLAERLRDRGLKVWYDKFEFRVGDGLRRSIDRGLASSRFGIVVLSPAFFAKHWPQEELEGLAAKEASGDKVILPVWHNITREELLRHSPMLAGRYAAQSKDGLDKVVEDLLHAVQADSYSPAPTEPKKTIPHLVAFGPNIICAGAIVSIEPQLWTLRIREFIEGDIGALIKFSEDFDAASPYSRYVLLGVLGDGRQLTAAVSLTSDGIGYLVRCPVAPSFPRIAAQELPSGLASSPKDGDIFVRNGQLARDSGLASLPQRLREALSLIHGESPFNLEYGSRLQAYYWRFRGTPWLNAMLTLDVIRMAAIPYSSETSRSEHTALLCVERVWSVSPLNDDPENGRLPMTLDLEIKGLGRGRHDVPVLMPDAEKTLELGKKGAQFARSIGLNPKA